MGVFRRKSTSDGGVPRIGRARRVGQWWMGSNSMMTVSLVLMVLLAGALLWLVVTPPNAAPADTAAPSPQAVELPAPTTAAPVTACPEVKAVDVTPEQLVLAEYATKWQLIDKGQVPTSKTAGPTDPKNHRCFAHSPEGALYAVATWAALNGDMTGGKFTGYQWMTYSPQTAVVILGLKVDTIPQTLTTRWTVQWSGDDWQVIPPTRQSLVVDKNSNLRILTPWGGA